MIWQKSAQFNPAALQSTDHREHRISIEEQMAIKDYSTISQFDSAVFV